MPDEHGLRADQARGADSGPAADQASQAIQHGKRSPRGGDEVYGGDGVTGTLQAFLTAFAALDWEPFRHCFADDATVFFPLVDHPERADGREQIEQLFRGVFERARAAAFAGPPYLVLEPRDLTIHRIGETALVTFHLCDPGVLCRRTLVLQRLADDWKIVHLHASNLPAPSS